jgi:hypothetical protein
MELGWNARARAAAEHVQHSARQRAATGVVADPIEVSIDALDRRQQQVDIADRPIADPTSQRRRKATQIATQPSILRANVATVRCRHVPA